MHIIVYILESEGKMAKLYITQDNVQNAFLLKGKQVLGRPSSNFTPDIPVSSKMVSRMHGEFITNENVLSKYAQDTLTYFLVRIRFNNL